MPFLPCVIQKFSSIHQGQQEKHDANFQKSYKFRPSWFQSFSLLSESLQLSECAYVADTGLEWAAGHRDSTETLTWDWARKGAHYTALLL